MEGVEDGSIALVVTSPPYPMIEMWDELFTSLNPEIGDALSTNSGDRAFNLMNSVLGDVWNEVSRVLMDGGIACINVGDATRKIGDNFQLYPSHSIISSRFRSMGFQELPSIIWRKPANSPNKFLGSGTLPAGAYVTLEHEYILIFRKAGRREFLTPEEKERRLESAFFWEERNSWFSDLWDITGIRQSLNGSGMRSRSAAFPFPIPYRLVNMYSVVGDTVLDPFMGTGTTALAALASCRNSVGYEKDESVLLEARSRLLDSMESLNGIVERRIRDHVSFTENELENGRNLKHLNGPHGFPVKTRTEKTMRLRTLRSIEPGDSPEQIVGQYS